MADKDFTMHAVAHIESDFAEKFGIPRQSGLVDALRARVVLEPPYRDPSALRGIEQFSHIWLLWQFTQAVREGWSPTVRPPRLGGNTRVGVFATRSPYRPNPIGLSCVRLERVEQDEALGPVLWVRGADLLDGTPIYDIKPYIPFADCRPDASEGYTAQTRGYRLEVRCPEGLRADLPAGKWEALAGVLSGDPRPSYQEDPERVYGMKFAGYEVGFTVADGVLTVCRIRPVRPGQEG